MANKSIIIGISGSSGIIYGIRLLEVLKELAIDTHLVVSKAGQLTRSFETLLSANELKSLATYSYSPNDIAAKIASGSFQTLGMIIAPCSMRTLGEIANATPSSLLTRAADVILKERRKLVLLPREAPLHLVHLRNMVAVTEMGGIIFPPVPAFYQKPQTIAELVDDTVGRVLDLFAIKTNLVKRWGE
jgi:4-hydroxy-3-polyprenylbenzoate decarboxylase